MNKQQKAFRRQHKLLELKNRIKGKLGEAQWKRKSNKLKFHTKRLSILELMPNSTWGKPNQRV